MSETKRVVELDDELSHRAVALMAGLMKQELDENKDLKGGRETWIKYRPVDHVLQIYYHCGKLQVAVKTLELLKSDEDSSRHEIEHQAEIVKEFAADVANHAFMVLDVMNLLGLEPPQPLAPKSNPAPKKEEKKKEYQNWS